MLRRVLPLACATALLLGACNQSPPPVVEKPAPPTTPDGSGRPGPDLLSMADSNAVAVLTQYGREHPETEVLVTTRLGNIRVRLFEDTPLHRANFLLLVNKGYFDQTVFYRVVKDFVAQGGNSDSRTIQLRKYHVPSEIRPQHFHRRGALGMARYDDEKNPQRLSSSHDFYFVQGQKLTPEQARATANRKLTPAQVKVYATEGGVPALDGQYTVFGEVIEGLDVVEKITNEPVDPYKWPLKDIGMKMQVVK
ncbi:peptidylprolyl isomerase [Hymenobacter sp. B81]|uniref:peptidylprolyl isomerase n=1 Tax=Hymenobacter sp. B81 TaxID=3344878 RepID=UPI0037DDD2F3